MKVIFLDIDGVLNRQTQNLEFRDDEFPFSVEFDKKAVSNLKKLLEQSQAKLVISSSWGRSMDFRTIAITLASHGIQGPYVMPQDIGQKEEVLGLRESLEISRSAVIPKKMSSEKCHEISWYLEKNSQYIESYVVLDDTPITWQEDRQVLTDSTLGLTNINIKKALKILKKPYKLILKNREFLIY